MQRIAVVKFNNFRGNCDILFSEKRAEVTIMPSNTLLKRYFSFLAIKYLLYIN